MDTIRELIKTDIRKGLSQTEIANKVGVSQPALYKYLETEVEPKLDTLKKFSKAYNIPLGRLTEEIDFIVKEDQTPYLTNRRKKILDRAGDLSDEELEELLDMIAFKAQRKAKIA